MAFKRTDWVVNVTNATEDQITRTILELLDKAREKNISRTTVGHLSDKDLKRLNIIIPKTNDNFNPTSVFENLLKKVIVNRNEIANLVTLRDFLLPMLMNGQISIIAE